MKSSSKRVDFIPSHPIPFRLFLCPKTRICFCGFTCLRWYRIGHVRPALIHISKRLYLYRKTDARDWTKGFSRSNWGCYVINPNRTEANRMEPNETESSRTDPIHPNHIERARRSVMGSAKALFILFI